jgi:hypothetical protein
MQNTKDLLIFINAGNCPHCKVLKEEFPRWSDDLATLGVRAVSVPVATMATPIDDSYPVDLRKYQRWYPMILLTSQSDWANALNNKRTAVLSPIIMNGDNMEVIKDGVKRQTFEYKQPAPYRFDVPGVIQFVKDQINMDKSTIAPMYKNTPVNNSSIPTSNNNTTHVPNNTTRSHSNHQSKSDRVSNDSETILSEKSKVCSLRYIPKRNGRK